MKCVQFTAEFKAEAIKQVTERGFFSEGTRRRQHANHGFGENERIKANGHIGTHEMCFVRLSDISTAELQQHTADEQLTL